MKTRTIRTTVPQSALILCPNCHATVTLVRQQGRSKTTTLSDGVFRFDVTVTYTNDWHRCSNHLEQTA